MLQDVVINDNEDDVIEEALHLLEAYTEPPFEILMENIDNVSNKFLEQVQILVRAGEPEYYMIELTANYDYTSTGVYYCEGLYGLISWIGTYN